MTNLFETFPKKSRGKKPITDIKLKIFRRGQRATIILYSKVTANTLLNEGDKVELRRVRDDVAVISIIKVRGSEYCRPLKRYGTCGSLQVDFPYHPNHPFNLDDGEKAEVRPSDLKLDNGLITFVNPATGIRSILSGLKGR